jgi:hypothetical protein
MFLLVNKKLYHAKNLFNYKNSLALKRYTYGQEQKNHKKQIKVVKQTTPLTQGHIPVKLAAMTKN